MSTFAFFADAGLTVPLPSLSASVSTAGGQAQGIVFFGSATPGRTLTRDGGVNLAVEVADQVAGAGLAAAAVKLALSASGLNSAAAGGALDLGPSLASGPSNSVAVFWRVTLPAGAAAVFADLSLAVNGLLEA